jgi:DNA-binding response OmpR family regulator
MAGGLSKTVLIVDDDTSFRALLADILGSRGLESVQARTGREASSIMSSGNPMLAIVDYRLPEIDGMTWVNSIREAGRNFPIIFLSGVWFDEKTFNRLRNILRVALILRKPIVPELFLQQIESLLPAQAMVKQTSMALSEGEIVSLQAIEEVDKQIESTENDAAALDQLRHVRSRLEREEKIATARANYANELAESWQKLSRAVSLVQTDSENVDARSEAVHLAHKIRGTAGSIGYKTAGEAAGKIEDLMRGLDPTDTLREVIWTEIFRSLAEGETAIRNSLDRTKEPAAQSDGPAPSNILLVGSEDKYRRIIYGLNTDWPVKIELTENQASALQKSKKMSFDAGIIDLGAVGKENLFELTKEIREIPGHEALPLSFICPEEDLLNPVDLAYAGCSLEIKGAVDKEVLETAINKLLTCRHLQKIRILTVDDDEVLTKFISTILSAEGMVVKPLNKPILIMEAMDQFKPDLVLLDVMMPGLSGYDVCRMLRTSEQWKTLPVLFLTSKSDQEGRAAAYQAGGNDFLSKPVLAEELITRVKAQLHIATTMKRTPDKDPTTGALKSDDFIGAAKVMLEHAQESQLNMTYCHLGLDDFVRLTFDHKWTSVQGALITLGKLLHTRFKAEDLRGRMGEDTFTLAIAGEKIETVADALQGLFIEFVDIEMPSETMGTFKATFSAGLAEYPADGETVEDLLNSANQRLLAARLERHGIIASAGMG